MILSHRPWCRARVPGEHACPGGPRHHCSGKLKGAGAGVWRATFEGFLEHDFAGEVNSIKVPAPIQWGDRDGLCSRGDQEALLVALAGSRLVVYERAGHGLH
jgi:pimeloyl-ACP methyl ester carboxylesterase